MKGPEGSPSGGSIWLTGGRRMSAAPDWELVSRSIEGYTQKLEGEVNRQHPARTWVERQEQKSGGHEPEQIPTTSECEHHVADSRKTETGGGCSS